MALAISCYIVIAEMLQIEYGPSISFAILCAAVICVLASLSVSELASMFPSAPGIRTYLKLAFGNKISLTITLMYISMVVLIAGVESFAFARIASRVGIDLPDTVLASTLVLSIVVLNLRGIEIAYKVQSVLTVALLIIFISISVYALNLEPILIGEMISTPTIAPDIWSENLPLLTGMAIFLFIGFEWVTPLGRRPESYRRLIPWSMPFAIVLLATLYALFVLAFIHIMPTPHTGIANSPQLLLGQLLLDQTGFYLMAILSVLAMLTSFNAGLMGASRLLYGIAREGELPGWVASLSIPACVPYAAILIIGVGAIISALVATLLQSYLAMTTVAASITCFTYLALVLAGLRLRKKQADRERPFYNPLPVAVQTLIGVTFFGLGIVTLTSSQDTKTHILMLVILSFALVISHLDKLSNLRFLKINNGKT